MLRKDLVKRGICEGFHAITLNVRDIIGNVSLKALRIFQPAGIFPRDNIKKQIIVGTILGICLESDLISSCKRKQSPPMTGLRVACVSFDL